MEVENVNVKNWKSLIKPSKLDVKISDDLTHAKIIAEPLLYSLICRIRTSSSNDRNFSSAFSNGNLNNFFVLIMR